MMDTNLRSAPDTFPWKNGPSPRPVRSRGPLELWYRLTAPAEPPENASLSEREVARRGRLTSATLLVVILLLLAAYPIAFLGPNHILAFVLLIPLSIDMVALFLNRAGKITAAGYVVVLGIEVGVGLSIIGPATSTGLTTYLLAQFDLLVQAEFVAVSLLRPRSVLWLAGLHIVLIVVGIMFLPHTPEFSSMFAVNRYEVFLRPITLQVIVAVVTYLWVTGAQQAIRRADRAEEIAALEQREIERQQREIEEKQQLDMGIQQILQTHVEVANGNFSARAPLSKDNVLWRIAYSLNNLLARLQGYSQMQVQLQRMQVQLQQMQAENYRLHNTVQSTLSAQNELQRTREAAARLIEALKQSKSGRMAPLSVQSGTIIDSVVMQLSNSAKSSEEKRTFPSARTRTEGRGI